MKYLAIFLFMILATSSFGQNVQKREGMYVDRIKRAYVYYVPASTQKGAKVPMIISLHGGFASPKGQFHLADFRPIADKDNFIVVCPASKHLWHDGHDNGGIDDVKFMDQLITYMIANFNVDPDRVYVTGISNGGFLTSRLACQLSNRIAAIAVIAASMDIGEGYSPVKPMPVIYMHGTADPIVPNKGGKKFGRLIYSQGDIIKVWAKMDDCDPKPVITDIPDTAKDGTSIVKIEYINHTTGNKVVGYSIINGGHTWPGGWQYFPKFIIGKTTKNLNACQEVWDFFKQYKLH